MTAKIIRVLTFSIIFLAFLAACSNGSQTLPGNNQDNDLERPVPPTQYSGMMNPRKSSPEDITEGKEIFSKYCYTCHGADGEGDGPASESLDPKPENLNSNQKFLSDAYMFWRISEGGTMEPFKSSMPPWKGVLNDDDIWKVIHFVRSLDQ